MPNYIDIEREKMIAALLLEKNSEAIIILYHHYSGALYHIILQIVKVEEIAQEVLQDAFIKIWEQGNTYDSSKGKLFTWMARVTRNIALDTLRSKIFKDGHKSEPLEDYVSNSVAFSDTPIYKDVGLEIVIDQLDEKYKQIIDYLYFKEYTQSEVSKALNLPLGTVKSRSRLAIKTLKGLLQDEWVNSIILFLWVSHAI